jgi:hypothetical protein
LKYKFIYSFITYISINCISIYRIIVYKKRPHETEIFRIFRDSTFSNSLIRVEYFFDNLIWIKFPQIGKKLFNGSVMLNSARMTFPYEITVRTKRGVKKYMVQQEEVQNTLQSEYYRVKEFASFKRIYRNPNLFNFPKLTLKNIIFYQSPKFYFQKNRTEIGKNLKINKINHSNFNRTDFL